LGFSSVDAAFFSKGYFTSGVGTVGGVKLSLVLALLVGLFWVYGVVERRGFRELFSREVKFGDVFFGALLLVFGTLAALRSGNAAFSLPYEMEVREALEKLFWVRPRFKELLFYPVFYVGTTGYLPHAAFFGVFALWSTYDSFLHFHTPILITLYRSLLGFFLPTLLTLIFLRLYRWFVRR